MRPTNAPRRVADVLQSIGIMANHNQTNTLGDKQQGDNRQAGNVDGNRGADPKKGTQGVNQSAGNQAGTAKSGRTDENPEPENQEP